MTEQELAIRCARKDKQAQKELYERYSSRILALCRRYSANDADAEDLMQDAFIKIFKNIGSFRWARPGSLYSWMSRVAINLAFDSYKKRRDLIQQLSELDKMEHIPDDSEYEDTSNIPLEVLSRMIEALPEGYRTVFKMYCIDGLSHKEIADLLRIKEKSSSASLSRARALLSSAIRQYWKEMDKGASDDAWLIILKKMRRADAVRNVMMILVVLIPLISLTFWKQTHENHDYAIPYIAQIPVDDSCIIARQSLSNPRKLIDRIPVAMNNTKFISNEEVEQIDVIDPIEENSANTVFVSESKHSEPSSDICTTLTDDYFPAIPDQVRRMRRKISFGLRAGSGSVRRSTQISLESSPYIASLTYMNTVDPSCLPNSKVNSSNAIPWYSACKTEDFSTESINDYHHDLPITFGITAHTYLNSRLGVECGVEYTYMHSSVETATGRLSQNMHFIGVPIRLDGRVWSWNEFSLYAGVGGKVEKCVAASLGQVQCEERRLQWSADTFVGLQYRLGKYTHLYFQPELSYYFTQTDLITYRTENPLTFSLNAGIRFDL